MSLLRVLRTASIRQFSTIPHRTSQVQQQIPRIVCQRRTFWKSSPSPPADDKTTQEAQKKAVELANELAQSPEWKKLAAHPPALKAIEQFVEILKEKGLDPNSGKQPGITTMMKLAADPAFRLALQNLKTEFQNAGVDLQNPEFLQKLQGLSGASKGVFPWSK
ncbi:hypothetical protein CC2G_010750 [Coprinopsis cinerea AmutBmut pab1-1]|nr:hypothetical protein CC2G_010750 [Coprinopsis cinerea AmutBmut pab1-1]